MNPPVGVATRVPTHHRDLRTLTPAGTNPLASPSGAEQGERTILVAEDDHSCRSALLQYFERSGYRVVFRRRGYIVLHRSGPPRIAASVPFKVKPR